VRQAATQIPDSNFRIALGSTDKIEQPEESVWPRRLMAGLLCLLLAGIAVDSVLHYLGIVLWSI
jgi:hypothetical protein